MKVFLTNAQHRALEPLNFHQQVESYVLNGVSGVVVEDKSFYLFASMHLDGNTDFHLVDTDYDDVKKLMINIVLDEVEEVEEVEEDTEESAESMQATAINAAIESFFLNIDMDDFYDVGGNHYELTKAFQARILDEMSDHF